MITSARYFDGQTAAFRELELRLAGGYLHFEPYFENDSEPESELVSGEVAIAIDQLRLIGPVGRSPWVIELAGGARLEFHNEAFARAIEPDHASQFIRWLENSWPLAMGALLVAIVSTWALLTWGVPSMARGVALALPTDIERALGDDGLGLLDKLFFEPSQLELETQQRLQEIFSDIIVEREERSLYRLEFRASPVIGANAFAIPGGLVVMTDEMVELAESDDELAAVLAHEVGHQVQRHSLRILLQDSMSALLIASLTGDLSNVSALSASIPTVLMQAKYSRDFEREADQYAFAWLEQAGIDSDVLSRLLLRLEAEMGVDSDADTPGNWLSSHPRSAERVVAGESQ